MLLHCWALFVLKWTLLHHSWNKRELWGYILLGFLLFCGILLSLVLTIIFYSLALHVSKEKSYTSTLLLLNGSVVIYLFFYTWGVLIDLQRSDLVDFRKMLFLPVSLPMIYIMNFLVSMISPIMLFALPGLIGLLAGFYPVHGISVFLVGIPLALLFMFMMNAWAYYLRGYLAIIMENKRRRRLALVLLPLCFVVLGQIPALLSHLVILNKEQLFEPQTISKLFPYLLGFDAAVPLFWPAYGIWSFINGASVLIVMEIAFGLFMCTLLGLYQGYISTLNHYMGVRSDTHTPLKKNGAYSSVTPPVCTSRRLPFLDDDTTALTLTFYHSFSRHPHVRMLIIMPLCLGLFFLLMYRTGAYGGHLTGEAAWIPVAALVWPFLNFSIFLFNIFGADAQAFSALTLFPTQRRKYFIAKNIALAPFVLGLSFFFIAASAVLIWAPVRMILLSIILAVHLYLLFSTLGNYLSLRFPYRINRDALRQPTQRLRMMLVGLMSTLLVAVMVLPTSLCMFLDRSYTAHSDVLVKNGGLLGASFLLIASLIVYMFTLTLFGDQFIAKEQILYARLHNDRE
ncbi:MAG: hypothetical protein KAH38_09305 [Candidatus Hydrogenedentes bacterium]|nr:hypothetical protein [Candidatus Hydrogenedentota bacterium]